MGVGFIMEPHNDGVSPLITRYKTLLELIETTFDKYAALSAYSCMGHTLTFAEVDRLSALFARYLQHGLGLQAGDRIAVQLPNILQFPVVLYGAMRAGLVVVNANPLYTSREIKYQLCDSGAKALVVLSNIAANASEIIRDTQVETVIVTDIADLHPQPKRLIINAVVKHLKKMVPAYSFPNTVSLRDALANTYPEVALADVSPYDLAVLQYTGGTTGVSKGAVLTHRNLAENVWQVVSHMESAFDEGKETFVACLPLYHIYALNLHALGAFSRGAHNILIPNPRDLAALVKEIKRHRMTIFIGINTLFNALCRFSAFQKMDFSSLKLTTSGGMALTEDAAKSWIAVTGNDICEGYGLTETSPVVCGNQAGGIQRGTIGLPVPETELKVIDDDGNRLPNGEAGELCVRGPQVMQGYWNNPVETAKVLSVDGWLKTGDIAVINDDGYVKIVDRKKDMILVSGFNVYPNEVEDIATQMPEILEAAAVGVADECSGEVVKLFVVRVDSTLTEEAVKAFCRQNLTGYKAPKYVEFRDALPKSNVGKILRKELRDS